MWMVARPTLESDVPVTNYHTLNGRIRGETTNGVRTNYLSDALGSVTGTTNPTAQLLNSYRHKPYGARLSKSGTTQDPRPGWVGQEGYRQTTRAYSTHYVQYREFSYGIGSWTSVDPLWPKEPPYAYVVARVTTITDPSGTQGVGDMRAAMTNSTRNLSDCCNWDSLSGCYKVPLSEFGKQTGCGMLLASLSKCGISGIDVICAILGKGECEQSARAFGVDPAILCGAMINENAGPSGTGAPWYDPQDPLNRMGIPFPPHKVFTPSRISTGCTQMRPAHARDCLDRLKKCNRKLYDSFGPLPSTSWGMLRKLAGDCKWSLRVAAACMYVETHKECGGTYSPTTFPVSWNKGAFPKNWPQNPGKDYYPRRAKCVIEALQLYYGGA